MTEREFFFPSEDVAIAKASGKDELAAKIGEEEETLFGDRAFNMYAHCQSFYRAEDDIGPEIRDFIRSPEFDAFEADEQRLSLRAYNVAETDHWAINGPNQTVDARLFEVKEYVGQVACVPVDRLTLTGAGAREFTNFEPELFKDYATYGFSGRLAFMQFAGAWLCTKTGFQYRDALPGVTMPDANLPKMERQIMMGGHMHGDFRLQELLLPTLGALTPLGTETTYAPLSLRAGAAGYHSVEKSIVTAICAYVIDNDQLTRKEKQRLFEVILSERVPNEEPERGASFYPDFGYDNHDDRHMVVELDAMRLNAVRHEQYFATIVQPGNEELKMIVRKNEQGELEIINSDSDRGICFQPTEIASLLSLFLNIGKAEARTAQNSIVHAITCAQQELLSEKEAGHVILGD